jgi:hypothetical protein
MARDDSRHHTTQIAARPGNQKHLQVDVQMFDEPQFKAVCEAWAEVLQGLAKALRDYDAGQECTWCKRT